jgi:16S rRNA (guanine(966)-N(2))-methyltransferase RsmD
MTLRIVGGKFRGRNLKTPNTEHTRPTTSMLREAFFNICAGTIEGARFLDLFAGSGAMGIEAISRGAIFTTCIEQDAKAFQCIKENVELLGIEPQVQSLKMDVLKALPRLLSPYDIIYVDPPYDQEALKVIGLIHQHTLLSPGGELFLEQRYDSKIKFTECPFEFVESRRYGIAHLHRFRCKGSL